MRKDAKVMFGVGGVLLAVLIVYFVSTSKKKATTTTPPVAVVVPGETPAVTPPVAPASPGDQNTIAPPAGATETPAIPASGTVEPDKKLPVPGPVVDSGNDAVRTGMIDPARGNTARVDKPADGNLGGIDSPAKPHGGETVYLVKANQTLSTISMERYGTSRHWVDIQNANPGINPKRLHIGDKLILPDLAIARPDAALEPGTPGVIPLELQATVLASETTISHPARGTAAPAADAAPIAGPPPVPGQPYLVRSGDSLYKISKLAYHTGKHADDIYEANKAVIGADKRKLKLNSKLMIPELPAAPATPAPTAVTDAGH